MKIRTFVFTFCAIVWSVTTDARPVRLPFDTLAAHWQQYIGQEVEISTPLCISGIFYDSLLLAPERLMVPEQYADGLEKGDSTRFRELEQHNVARSARLCTRFYGYKLQHGNTIRGLRAKVTAERQLLSARTPSFRAQRRLDRLPDLGDATVRLCMANIQNYFADLGGYAGAKTPEEFERQTTKIAKGLLYLDADIYALCEIERGPKTVSILVDAMNRMAHAKGRYAWVDLGFTDGDTISCGYIYRADRVQPYGTPQFAVHDPSSHYHYRFVACGFRELASGESMVLNINHLRSKRGTPQRSDSIRMDNVDSLLHMIRRYEEARIFDDPDVLLVGDWNCYRRERPIRYLVSQGYQDVLERFDPDGYSYVYRGTSGYLDQAFATPSMMAQITAAHPVHLCADYYYSLGYKRGSDLTRHRYSDHDPVLIGIRLRSAAR
ncbi:MAG: hypothetical protein II551_06225 [Paludibacteraceae bacterium]|nr:hypothetical protein [Paludibacteraceae bacterium]